MMEYVSSVGRYGPSPYIYPRYGTSEFSQAFCRFAAVNGAVYILHKRPVSLTFGTAEVAKKSEDVKEIQEVKKSISKFQQCQC